MAPEKLQGHPFKNGGLKTAPKGDPLCGQGLESKSVPVKEAFCLLGSGDGADSRVSPAVGHPHIESGICQHESEGVVGLVNDPGGARIQQTMLQQHHWFSLVQELLSMSAVWTWRAMKCFEIYLRGGKITCCSFSHGFCTLFHTRVCPNMDYRTFFCYSSMLQLSKNCEKCCLAL